MNKRLVIIQRLLLVVLIWFRCITISAFEVDGIKYYIEGDYIVSVVGKSRQMSSLNIPETVQYGNITYRVREIAETAFENCTDIVSVSIPKTIQFVGLDAFAGCTSLNKVIVSDIAAFCNIEFEKADDSDGNPIGLAHHLYKDENTEYTELVIPETVKSIPEFHFYQCYSFTSIVLPNSITSLGFGAFSGCKNVKSVTLSNSLTNIPSQAFYDCNSLESIELPDGITSIGSRAFYDCNSLESIELPDGITSIGVLAFSGCKNVRTVIFSNSLTTIQPLAFQDCTSLESLELPDGVQKIGYAAFKGCTNLSSVVLPNSLSSLTLNIDYRNKGGAFENCSKLSYVKSHIESPFNISSNTFKNISSTAVLEVPKGTKEQYQTCSGWADCFKDIIEEGASTTYVLSITVSGNGSATYDGTAIRSNTSTFEVNEGTNVTITFTPDEGNRIKSIKVNNTDVTSSISNNTYAISNISNDISVEVEFEAIPPTIYTLSIQATGNGSVSYGDTSVKDKTNTFAVNEGTSVTITLTPDDGYRVKSLVVNNTDVTSSISNNQYTISSINANTSIVAEFEVIPPTTYTLSIKASGNGSVRYGDTSVRIGTKTFTVIEDTSADLIIIPDEAHLLKSFIINNTDVTSKIVDNKYSISNINSDISVEVQFKAIETLTYDGMEFKVTSTEQKEVAVAKGDYGLWIEVPETVSAYNYTWTVAGFEDGAFESATGLAAVIWNPQVKFKEKVTNPNLLLYVKSAVYAPTDIKNVIVNGKAKSITLYDAASENNFYCPQEFTAENITYEHNYSMKTGYSTCQGWETIVLPFDVTVVTNNIGTELVPYTQWTLGDSKRPFWLCSMNEDGWKNESAIKANAPYIISMPNNDNYDATYNISGNIVFSASNVTVQASNNLVSSKHGHRNLVPNYQNIDRSSDIYALNVNNLWSTNTDSNLAEGSAFIRDSRQVRPFEAYMTIDSGGGTTRSINIFDDNETTGIMNLPLACKNKDGVLRVYSLSGMLLKQGNDEKILNDLPKGVYVVNGKKIVK